MIARRRLRLRGSSGRMGLRAVFAQPGYRRLWSARTVSRWGDVFATVALVLLVFDLTGSALGASAVVFAEIIPVLLLGPFAGTLVDRMPRVTVMVVADLWRALLAIALIPLADSVVAVYLVAFGLSVGAVLFNPAANSVLPALVTEQELLAANSGIWTAAVVSQIALAPLAGILYAALGAGPAFGINAASFMLSAALLVGLRLPAAPNRTQRRGFFADAAACLRLLLADRLLRTLGAGQLLAALSAGATSALLVVLARDHLDLDPSGYGLLLGAIGVGAVLGPFLLTRLVSDPRRPLFVFGPYVLRGVVDLALAIFPALPVALVALTVYGLGTSTGAVTFNSLLQAHVPEHARGRIFASFDVLWQLGSLISLLLGGLLAAWLGVQSVYYLGRPAAASRRRTRMVRPPRHPHYLESGVDGTTSACGTGIAHDRRCRALTRPIRQPVQCRPAGRCDAVRVEPARTTIPMTPVARSRVQRTAPRNRAGSFGSAGFRGSAGGTA